MSGIGRIAERRQRQISDHHYDRAHDDEHVNGELKDAAIAYAMAADASAGDCARDYWPWDDDIWHPDEDPIETLANAGALIAAEIDRLERLRKPKETT